MKILLDAGNSRIKWACCEGARLEAGEPVSSHDSELERILDQLWSSLPMPEAVWVANVAGPVVEQSIRRCCERRWRIDPRVVRSTRNAAGVTNAYRTPGALGVDRWLALVGAYSQIRGAACVVDCGTALTIDLLDQNGMHRGGLIMPGYRLMQHAVLGGTGIESVSGIPVGDTWGSTTADCLSIGAMQAVLGTIERAWRNAMQSGIKSGELLLTGGDAGSISPHLDIAHRVDPLLVLRGLGVIGGGEWHP